MTLNPDILREVYENAIGPSNGITDPEIQQELEDLIAQHGPLLGLIVRDFYNALETHNVRRNKLEAHTAAMLAGSILTFMNLLKGFKEHKINQRTFTSEQIKAGSKRIMTHQERQRYVKESGLLKLYGLEEENESL